MKFKSSRNYIVYDKPEKVVRFAMTSEVEPLETEDDPCRKPGAPLCQANSYCMNDNSIARCMCTDGFEEDPNNMNSCVDVDECKSFSVHQCDLRMANSRCINTVGSYECACRPNYIQKQNECIMVSKISF